MEDWENDNWWNGKIDQESGLKKISLEIMILKW